MDWAGLMAVGLRGLKLTPAAFWALTPAELMVMLGANATTPAMGRARLDELAALYPDTGDSDEHPRRS